MRIYRKYQKTDEAVDRWIDNIRLHSPQPSEEHSAEKAYKRLTKRVDTYHDTHTHKHKSLRDYRPWLVAATAAILLTVGGLRLLSLSQSEAPTLLVANNNSEQVREVTLPDGSMVKLNAHSKMIYPERFDSKRREVFLDGEGFFEVTHDKKHPFVVRAGELSIRVLGTKFNVKANSLDTLITTTLLEGSVRVEHQADQLLMKPGQRMEYDVNTKQMRLLNVKDAERSIRWTHNIWMLTDMPLTAVCNRIERLYGVKFIITNERLLKKSFTGEFHLNESLDSLLRTMRACESFEYERKGDNIILK
jgi:ferric-dicitrate binding protein FerR (iron transport regulator)